MSTFTPALNLELVARGDDVGTWDTPTNSNWSIVDSALGGVATVPLTNSNITLSAPQYQCNFITFTGAISANIAITLPAVGRFYTIQNLTSNTSAFYITMTTTAGGEAIGIPPGTPTEIFTDGTNVKFRSMGTVNKYEDWAVSSAPLWLTACTKPPYLNCDGTSFSSATYPVTTVFLGGTTLPDAQGRFRATLNQGQTRINSTGSGLDGGTILAGGGSEMTQQHSHVNTTLMSGSSTFNAYMGSAFGTDSFSGTGSPTPTAGPVNLANLSVVSSNYGTGNSQNIPPAYMGGLTFLRVA